MILPADPRANYLAHREEIDEAVARVLARGQYILGPETEAFEEEFARYLGVKEAVAVASGTDALVLALRACGVGPGDRVVTVSHTAVATVAAIELAGAEPVLVDVDPGVFIMDAAALEAAASASGAKAVIPVHLYGRPAGMEAILEVSRRHGLFVIEDCAQSHGARIGEKRTGAFGHAGAFSFYPTKNLGALGDGGAVATNDSRLSDRVRRLRQYGWGKERVSETPGMNSRLDEIQAAVLRVKLRHLDRENARRRELAALYRSALRDSPLALPEEAGGVTHVYHQFAVLSGARDALRADLHQHGYGAAIHYPVPVHRQPAYSGRVRVHGDMIATDQIARTVLSLPIYPELPDRVVRDLAARIIAAAR